ncbi:MAG: hypothetical protein ACM3PU_01475 [Gemmatimonadota bacterium]
MFSEETIRKVWQKGRARNDRAGELWRQDECGAWMHRPRYGDASAEFGWKIDRTSVGGENDVDGLRPFHVANSYDIANGRPHCRVTADRSGLGGDAHTEEPRNRTL